MNDEALDRLFEEGLRLLDSEGRAAATAVWGRVFDLETAAADFREFAERVRRALRSHGSISHPWAPELEALARRAEAETLAGCAVEIDRLCDAHVDADFLLAMGDLHARFGEPARARELFARALECDPGRADAFARLAGSETRAGDHDRAVEHAARALALDPFDCDAYRALLISAALRGDLDVVERASRRARQVVPDPRFVDDVCAEAITRGAACRVRFEGGDGRDSRHPVLVRGAESTEIGSCAEKMYAERVLGRGWAVEDQSVFEECGRWLECVLFERDSETRRLYFDVTDLHAQASAPS
jgi:tetratricopeptide (TPR) repeat protein